MLSLFSWAIFFFFNDTATTEIYTLSLHDALPITRDATNKQILFTVLAVAASIGVADASGPRQQSGDSIGAAGLGQTANAVLGIRLPLAGNAPINGDRPRLEPTDDHGGIAEPAPL